MRSPSTLLRVVTALVVVLVGYSHLYLWKYGGYRYTPVRQLFLLDFAAGAVIGLLALIGPRRIAGLLAAGLGVVTFAAYALSRGPGVPTNNGTFTEKGWLEPTSTLHVLGLNPALLLMICEAASLVFGLALIASAGKGMMLHRKSSTEAGPKTKTKSKTKTSPTAGEKSSDVRTLVRPN